MTTFQMVAVGVLALTVVWQYLPALKLPTRKPNVMGQIESVIEIRESSQTPEVKSACNALLQALLR